MTACIKEESPILISGEFERVSGTCTPYCIIELNDDVLILNGIDESGSTEITYSERYERDEEDINRYYFFLNREAYVEVAGEDSFTYVSPNRTCVFEQKEAQ